MMNEEFTVVDPDTGIVRFSGFSDDPELYLADLGQVVVGNGSMGPEYYWTGTEFKLRPDLDTVNEFKNVLDWIADGEDLITYGDNLPNPTTVTIRCTHVDFVPVPPFDITDGSLELTADLAADYTILLHAPPFLDKEITVTALQDPKFAP